MGRRFWNDGQEIVLADLNAISSALQRELYDRLAHELVQRTANSFFGDSFKVTYSNANTVSVAPGLGLQTDNTQVSPEPTVRPIYLASAQNLNISAPDSSNPRVDIVVVKNTLANELTLTRKVKSAIDSSITNENLTVQKDWGADLQIIAGVADPSPVAPATPAGYIKIATLAVAAVSGLSGAGDVADNRILAPLGENLLLNTVGYERLTAGAAIPVSTLMADIDTLLKNGYFEYFDIDEINSPTAEPGNPAASRRRIFYRDSVLYIKNSAGQKVPVGSGGGGGGAGANWVGEEGNAPLEDIENNEKVFLFEDGATQAVNLFLKIPSGYISGMQLKMNIGFYSPSSSNFFRFETTSTLIKKNVTAINDTTDQESDNVEVENTLANMYQELQFELTDVLGNINGEAVGAGDVVKIRLQRIAPVGATDTADVRFVPSLTEVTT